MSLAVEPVVQERKVSMEPVRTKSILKPSTQFPDLPPEISSDVRINTVFCDKYETLICRRTKMFIGDQK